MRRPVNLASYKLRESAVEDLDRIWFYGAQTWGIGAADNYRNDLFLHFEDLAENPNLYPVSDIRRQYRRSVCGKEQVYYRVTDSGIEIVAIIGRQDVGAWLK